MDEKIVITDSAIAGDVVTGIKAETVIINNQSQSTDLKSGTCPKCQSTHISKEKLGIKGNLFAKIIEYPGLGEKFTCSECGYHEKYTLGAPTQTQMRVRIWILALRPLVIFMCYLLISDWDFSLFLDFWFK